MMKLEDRFSTLEAVVTSQRAALEEQRAEIAKLKDQLPRSGCDLETIGSDVQAVPGGATIGSVEASRRSWLKGGALAAGAAVVGATMAPRTASAADGSNLVIGANNTSAGGNTRINGTGLGAYLDQNILRVSDHSATSQFPAAIGAYGEGDRVQNGLYAYAGGRDVLDTSTGFPIVANNAYGRANLLLVPGSGDPNHDTIPHRAGSVRSDIGGNLWFCTSDGTPGRWRKLAGPQSAGAVHAIDPVRVYDSRLAAGPLESGFNRIVRVADGIDVHSGVVNHIDVVEEGAKAVFFNVAITLTTGAGFVLVAPGYATAVTASTVNWTGANQTVVNGSFTTLNSVRNVKVFAGGNGSTEFILDITGYML